MRKTIIAATIVLAATGAQAQQYNTEHTGLVWELVKNASVVGGLIRIGIDLYEWVDGKLRTKTPEPRAADLWYCEPSVCKFGQPGATAQQWDYDQAMPLIQAIGKDWQPNDVVIVCNGWVCFKFTYTGASWVADGPSFTDPRIGYTNKPTGGYAGGGEGSASSTRTYTSTWYSGGQTNLYGGSAIIMRRGSVTTTCVSGCSSHYTGVQKVD